MIFFVAPLSLVDKNIIEIAVNLGFSYNNDALVSFRRWLYKLHGNYGTLSAGTRVCRFDR